MLKGLSIHGQVGPRSVFSKLDEDFFVKQPFPPGDVEYFWKGEIVGDVSLFLLLLLLLFGAGAGCFSHGHRGFWLHYSLLEKHVLFKDLYVYIHSNISEMFVFLLEVFFLCLIQCG